MAHATVSSRDSWGPMLLKAAGHGEGARRTASPVREGPGRTGGLPVLSGGTRLPRS